MFNHGLTKLLPPMTSILLNNINSFWLLKKMYKNMFLYEITHRYLQNDYQFFDTSKTKHGKIRRNCNLLTKVKFYKLEWSSPLSSCLQMPCSVLSFWRFTFCSKIFNLISKCNFIFGFNIWISYCKFMNWVF